MGFYTIVLYEWLRGARTPDELRAQQALFPPADLVPFEVREASTAASLYRKVRRPRGREIDLAIAACAIVDDASFWTLHAGDFTDIPGLILVDPAA